MADRLRQNPDDITIEDEDTDDLPGALADDDEDDDLDDEDLDLEDEE